MSENVIKRVGATIRRLREEAGYSQEGFAQIAQIDRSRYGRIERGEINFSLRTLFQLAAALKIDAWEIIRDIRHEDISSFNRQP